jgi:hypothetical protein
MTLRAKLDFQHLFGGAGGKSIAADTHHFGIGVIFGVNLNFHYFLASVNADFPPIFTYRLKLHGTVGKRKESVITPYPHVSTWVNVGAALPNKDGTGIYLFAGKPLNAQHLGLGITTVPA